MNTALKTRLFRIAGWLTAVAVIVVAVVTYDRWWPPVRSTVESWTTKAGSTADAPAAEHAGHDHAAHGDAGHDDATSLHLSPQALRNLGLTGDRLDRVQLTQYSRSITVPAIVTERPGRTQIQVATPMTGVITHVHAVHGEAVQPGSLLFQIRLTHEDLVRAQTDFVRTLGELDIEQREIERLSKLTESGGVAGKVLLEREYSRDKLQSLLSVQREALRLHGLSSEQVQQIEETRTLLRELRIFAPGVDEHPADEIQLVGPVFQPVGGPLNQPPRNAADHNHSHSHDPAGESQPDGVEPHAHDEDLPLILHELLVHKGQAVNAGETLAVLGDYSHLYIEGLAFEQDIELLTHAAEQDFPITAVLDSAFGRNTQLRGLRIAWLDSQIDPESRSLRFYVDLTNQLLHDSGSSAAGRYVNWRFRPGQRMQLRVPVEQWDNQIVLPIEAVTAEGAEYFVFVQNGDHFDRVPVHVKHRDQQHAVVANDGQLFPGDVVAMHGAHQLQMAIKNKAGGGVDPHAGHSH